MIYSRIHSTFIATFKIKFCSHPNTVYIFCFSGNGSAKGGNSSQPLVQWSEVPGHTGLLYCMTQSTNNPVVLMIKPDAILVQEIKVVPAKAKVNS